MTNVGAQGDDDGEQTFADSAKNLEERIRQHDELRDEEDFRAQQKRLNRLTFSFIDAVRAAAAVCTRDPDSARKLLQFSMDDFIESALSIYMLGEQGIFNVGRRELRYMLEAGAKAVYVDDQLPGTASLDERLAYLADNSNVPRSSINVVDQMPLRLLADPGEFRRSVHSAFGALSGYTHVSRRMLDERVRRISRDEGMGFEQASTLRVFNSLVALTYDLVLAMILEGIGPMFAGDLFRHVFDFEDRWPYAKTRFISHISAGFDYRHTR
ncbi:hypothetical protein AB0P28_15155 [Pseudarthrobacter sp. NPDC089323]